MNERLLVQSIDGLSDDAKALLQLLGGASGAVSTTQLAFLYDAIMLGVEKAIEKAQAEGTVIEPKWCTASQVGKMFCMGRSGVNAMLSKLVAQGLVRTWCPKDGKGKRIADTRYSIEDLQKAGIETEQQTKK